jgi:putative tricarboxylic transport membrane protein
MGKTYIILPIAHPANRLGGFKLRFGGMNIEKAIALFLALVLAVYSYTAFFEMDYLLPPILQRNPVWPSTFPKILSVMGLIACALVFLNIEKSEKQVGDDLDISNWRAYKIIHAFSLIFGMVVYALVLRPLGFIGATFILTDVSTH